MSKLLTALIAATFATVTFAADAPKADAKAAASAPVAKAAAKAAASAPVAKDEKKTDAKK